MINILSTPSNNYTMPCGIMFYSACVNNKKGTIHFFIICDESFQEENKKKLRDTVEPFGNKLDFIIIDDKYINNIVNLESSWYPKYVFYRIFMAELFPTDIHKMLYLDCDIIVRHSLDSLWNIDLTNYSLACVPDSQEGTIEYYNRLEYPAEKGYFNAGVLLANLDYWREHQIGKKIKDFIANQSQKIKFQDQDILNYNLWDSKLYLPLTYNFQSGFLYKKRLMNFEYLKYKESLEEAKKDPIILHLSGVRPWIEKCPHPMKDEFYKYKAQTIWKDEPLQKRPVFLMHRIINALRKPLSKYGVSVRENPYDYQSL